MSTRSSNRYPLSLVLKIAAFLVAVVLVFHLDLATVAVKAVQNESASYVLAVPVLFAYLLYRKRKMLRAVMPLESQAHTGVMKYLATIGGLLLTSAALVLYWYSSSMDYHAAYHILTLPIFAAGLTLILFNTQTLKESAFPMAFLVLLTPPSGILTGVGEAFSSASSKVSFALIRAVGIPSTLSGQPPVIQVVRSGGEALGFTIGNSSSGVYSVLGFLVFAIFISYTIRDRLWKKLLLFPIGFLIIYALSLSRITAVLLIGYNFGIATAMNLFLLLGGWVLIFLGTFLTLFFSEKVLHTQIFSKPPQKCPKCSSGPQADQDMCFSCGRILRPSQAKFGKTDLVKIVATIALLALLTEAVASFQAVSEFISQRGLYLAVTILALFPAVMVFYVLETRELRREDAEFYLKLSTGNKQVIDTVRETEIAARPTLNAITETYESKTGEPIAYQEMLRKLFLAEKTGIIESRVDNVQDEPLQVWRSHIKPPEEELDKPVKEPETLVNQAASKLQVP
ncbi:MAG: exosortase/archaeosortase family protein [Candidatus Bathyarchaeia archaeon]